MDMESLAQQLPHLRAEATRWREQEAEAARKAEGYEAIIRGVESVIDAPPAVATAIAPAPEIVAESNGTPGPRGIAAVRRVMLEHPARIWRAKEIHAELERNGWISAVAQHPLRGTEAAINRLWKRGEVDRVGAGRYRATESMRRESEEG